MRGSGRARHGGPAQSVDTTAPRPRDAPRTHGAYVAYGAGAAMMGLMTASSTSCPGASSSALRESEEGHGAKQCRGTGGGAAGERGAMFSGDSPSACPSHTQKKSGTRNSGSAAAHQDTAGCHA